VDDTQIIHPYDSAIFRPSWLVPSPCYLSLLLLLLLLLLRPVRNMDHPPP
jgi:hypothetical protein